jgi:hypothetical protein
MEFIPTIFSTLSDAHKHYLYLEDYPNSSIEKFLNFLKLINMIKED